MRGFILTKRVWEEGGLERLRRRGLAGGGFGRGRAIRAVAVSACVRLTTTTGTATGTCPTQPLPQLPVPPHSAQLPRPSCPLLPVFRLRCMSADRTDSHPSTLLSPICSSTSGRMMAGPSSLRCGGLSGAAWSSCGAVASSNEDRASRQASCMRTREGGREGKPL